MNINEILANLNTHYATITDLIPDLYKFDDAGGTGYIDDGFFDMFDDANMIYTNIFEGEGGEEDGIPYTHTQRVETEEEEDLDETGYINPPMDGAVVDGSSYFGNGSSYFTNMYPGLFVLAATNTNITRFLVDGNIGADGGGTVTVYDPFTISTNEGNFVCYTKCVDEAGDPSINHIIIVPSGGEIEHTWDEDTDDDTDQINSSQPLTSVFYLLTARCVEVEGGEGGEFECEGQRLSESNIQDVAEQFLTAIFGEIQEATPRPQIIVYPRYTFQVIGYDPQQFCGQLLPDSMENILHQLNNRTVWVERVGAFKHGERFIRSGALAHYLKKLYVDVPSPTLAIVGCDTGETECGSECVDLQSDAANCGECGNECGIDEICESGECVLDPDNLTDAVELTWGEQTEFNLTVGVPVWVYFVPPSTNSTVYVMVDGEGTDDGITEEMVTADNIKIFTEETFPNQIAFSEGVNPYVWNEYWGVYFGDTEFTEGATYYARIDPVKTGTYNVSVGFD